MERKFTKGKWEVNKNNDVYSCYNLPIAVIYDGSTAFNSFKESSAIICKSNALLISKAPEMFEMLVKIKETTQSESTFKAIEQLLKEATEL